MSLTCTRKYLLCLFGSCAMGIFLVGCDLFSEPAPRPVPPTGPTPPQAAPTPGQAPPEVVEEVAEEAPVEEKASSEVFDLISKRVHQCGSDAQCTIKVGQQLEKVTDASVKGLIPVVESSASTKIRSESMRMLAQRRITEALPALVRVLERERDTELQEAAALALRDIGDPEAVPPLTKALKDAESLRMKEVYIRALGGFQSPTAVMALSEAAQGAGRDLFLTIVSALGTTHQPEAIPLLEKASQSEDLFTQLEAIHALGTIPDPKSVEALRSVLLRPEVAARVKDVAKRNHDALKEEVEKATQSSDME